MRSKAGTPMHAWLYSYIYNGLNGCDRMMLRWNRDTPKNTHASFGESSRYEKIVSQHSEGRLSNVALTFCFLRMGPIDVRASVGSFSCFHCFRCLGSFWTSIRACTHPIAPCFKLSEWFSCFKYLAKCSNRDDAPIDMVRVWIHLNFLSISHKTCSE